jgi:N-dimethylarginine dimethylaminohydrolase
MLARRVRRSEELPVTRALAKAGCPILGTLHGEAVFEGGGFAILDEKTAVCSPSVACNAEGVRQMRNILGTMGIELIPACPSSDDLRQTIVGQEGRFWLMGGRGYAACS